MKRLHATLAAAFLAIGFAVSAGAFSYQGALADASGTALKGTQTVEFRLYANETGGSALWGRACNVLLDDNGTPDLRGRFVVGYDPNDSDYNAPGRTGGEKTHTLTTDEMASHSHNIALSIWGYVGSRKDLWEVMAPEWYYSNKQTISSQSVGGNQTHENRPPYYALCYIMRVK